MDEVVYTLSNMWWCQSVEVYIITFDNVNYVMLLCQEEIISIKKQNNVIYASVWVSFLINIRNQSNNSLSDVIFA